MCGIAGYVGDRESADVLVDALSKLEYRGYDSAGIAVFDHGNIKVKKCKGRLANLVEKMDEEGKPQGHVGIGHTRWATHGEPSDINSHPHGNKRVTIVHNGIIENYKKLKDFLIGEGYSFASETDTEVAAKLLDYYYDGDPMKTIAKVLSEIKGSYALGIMFRDFPDEIFAVRKDSPLIVGVGEHENFIASDVPAIIHYTRDYYLLDQNEIAVIKKDSVKIYDVHGNEIHKELNTADWDVDAAEKGGYAHFMLKEIHEQPRALRDTISPRIQQGKVVLDELHLSRESLAVLKRIYVVACGSAYYVGCLAKYLLEQTCQIPVEPIQASEFRYANPVLCSNTLVLIISQSGETADTLAALREAKRQGARTLAIVNVVGSAIAKAADQVIYTWAGPEIAVATTKAYSTQLAVIDLLALYISEQLGTLSQDAHDAFLNALLALPEQVCRTLTPERIAMAQQYASTLFTDHDVFYIGRNLDSAICLEGSLKLKEIAYIHSEAYAAGELKHGPISLIEPGTLVIAVATIPSLFDKTMANIREVKARGAKVLCLTLESMAQEAGKTADYVLPIPETHPLLQPSLNVIPLQVLAYYAALARGCDVDKPRNLAKSVTVE